MVEDRQSCLSSPLARGRCRRILDRRSGHLVRETGVAFNGIPACEVTFVNTTLLRVLVPAGEVGPVRITAGDASLTNAFAYISPFAPSGLRAPEQTTLDECGARLQPAPFVGGGPQVLEHA